MKWVLKSLLVISLLFAVMVPIAYAAPALGEPDVLFEKAPIQDLETLFERAKGGISDLEPEAIGAKVKATLIDKQTGTIREVETCQTTQLLRVEQFPDGTKKERYATTTFALVPPPQQAAISKEPILIAMVGDPLSLLAANKSDDDWDSIGGVFAYSTIYWDWHDDDRIYAGLISANGGWINYDYPQTLITSRHVSLGQSGGTQTGTFSDSRDYYPTGNFSYNAPSSWNTYENAVNVNFLGSVGCDTWAELDYVGGGSETLYLQNII